MLYAKDEIKCQSRKSTFSDYPPPPSQKKKKGGGGIANAKFEYRDGHGKLRNGHGKVEQTLYMHVST